MKRLLMLVAMLTTFSSAVAAPKTNYLPAAPRMESGKYFLVVNNVVRPAADVFSLALPVSTEKPVYYFQNYGGGGIGLFLVTGPLGAVANGVMVKSKLKSEASALSSKIEIDPVAVVSTAVHKNGLSENDSGSGIHLYPFVIVVKGHDKKLHIALVIDVDGDSWAGRYTYHIKDSLPYADLVAGLSEEQRTNLSENLSEAAEKVVGLLKRDVESGLPKNKEQIIYSESISPRTKFKYQAALVEDYGGDVVYSVSIPEKAFKSVLASGYHIFEKTQVIAKDR